MTKCLCEECEAKHEAFGKFCVLKEQFVVLKHEQGKCNQHLSSCLQKIESLSNVSRRLKRREEKIEELTNESYTLRKELKEKLLHKSMLKKEFDEVILEKEIQISQINETLDCALKSKSRAQKLKWYYKNAVYKKGIIRMQFTKKVTMF